MQTEDTAGFTPMALEHARHPRNFGALTRADGNARMTGPCGETMECWVKVRRGRIEQSAFIADGCGSSRACGSIATCLAIGKTVEDAAALSPREILDALGGLPPDFHHCALLAASTLTRACANALRNSDSHHGWAEPSGSGQVRQGIGGGQSENPVDTEMPITLSVRHGHAHCLLCGQRNPSSWGVTFDRGEDNSVHGTVRPNADLQGYDGMLHGGVIAALLDAAMTHCLFHIDVRAVTGDLHVRFLQPVASTATVDIQARIISATTPLYYLKAELRGEGRVMAWGEGTFVQCDRGNGRTRNHSDHG